MNKRLFVLKKEAYQIESTSLLADIKENLYLNNLKNITKYNIYDIFNANETDISLLRNYVLSEVVTDNVFDNLDLNNVTYISYENLPGQYDQRADSAEQCLSLLNNKIDVVVKSGVLLVMEGELSTEDIEKIKYYVINPIEMREKDLSILTIDEDVSIEDEVYLENFIQFDEKALEEYRSTEGLAMSRADLAFVQTYFKEEGRDPSLTEIKVLDTYWSDHCRHTTFETKIDDVRIEDGSLKNRIEASFQAYLKLRKKVHQNRKEMTLMDLATIGGKHLRQEGKLDDLEISNEINACSIEIKVDNDGVEEDWLLMFKNETHNHPTEIEPFGGASTCIGGAIRDPLSGRSYVYQAMRVSGAGDITKPLENTIEYKLPQRKISKGAAHGYSSYGNQIGLATTYVKELYHDGYTAKRMEVGAVIGAVKKEYVVREEPIAGDIVVLLGGATGRDGIGGATGSSKEHTNQSLTKSFSEVQKGNAPMERRIQRLFRNPTVTRKIKKANDFGAGGVCVAIGELAEGIHINLDNVPTKYAGLSGLELAISESQERMAVVIAKEDYDAFETLAYEENLTISHVATISDDNRLIMRFKGNEIVNISRDFLNTNGVRATQKIAIDTNLEHNPFVVRDNRASLDMKLLENLKQPNVASQKGMVEMFDCTIGASTVLMPFGGKYKLSENEGSVQKIPTLGFTKTVSMMAYGYDSMLGDASPYLTGAYSVVEALARISAMGGTYQKARLSQQEYFERLGEDEKRWGKPMQALLGVLDAQLAFDTPSIGGKDSMSGSFNELHVPPTMITFAITTEQYNHVISTDFKQADSFIYVLRHQPLDDFSPNYEQLKENFSFLQQINKEGNVRSASTIKAGGIAESLCKMSFGNHIGVQVETNLSLFDRQPGSIVIETSKELDYEQAIYVGKTTNDAMLHINQSEITIKAAIEAWASRYESIYPTLVDKGLDVIDTSEYTSEIVLKANKKIEKPNVLITVFPGNNCEDDSKKAFEKAGGEVDVFVFNNTSIEGIKSSIKELANKISKTQILMIPGGFSAGDEPDGSGKFIATILRNETVYEAIQTLLSNDGLILGICNGFQALVKAGFLPYGNMEELRETSPTLFRNNINRHVSKVSSTKISSNKSPWLSSFTPGEVHQIAFSHGEGKFVVNETEAKALFANGQVATQYCNLEGQPTMDGEFNINGSYYAIEGITSLDGRIFGKMGHSERYEEGLFLNIEGNKVQNIFKNGIDYFK